eukprot:gene46373-62020_t
MLGKELHRGQGVSFDGMEGNQNIVLQEKDTDKKKALEINAPVDILYGRTKYRGKILKDRGHACYDVQYNTGDKEAG